MAELDACHRCRKSKKGPSQFMTQKVPKHVLYRPLKGYNCFNDFFVGYRFYYGPNLTACLVRCDPLDSRFVLRTIMVVTVWYLAWFYICYETFIHCVVKFTMKLLLVVNSYSNIISVQELLPSPIIILNNYLI